MTGKLFTSTYTVPYSHVRAYRDKFTDNTEMDHDYLDDLYALDEIEYEVTRDIDTCEWAIKDRKNNYQTLKGNISYTKHLRDKHPELSMGLKKRMDRSIRGWERQLPQSKKIYDAGWLKWKIFWVGTALFLLLYFMI